MTPDEARKASALGLKRVIKIRKIVKEKQSKLEAHRKAKNIAEANRLWDRRVVPKIKSACKSGYTKCSVDFYDEESRLAFQHVALKKGFSTTLETTKYSDEYITTYYLVLWW